MTKKRKLVLDILNNSQGHLYADEIFEIAKQTMPKIVFATIYNSLNFLCENEYIKKVQMPNNTYIFDKTVKRHDHLICSSCKKIQDIEIANLDNLVNHQNIQNINDYSLFIFNTCSDCTCKTTM